MTAVAEDIIDQAIAWHLRLADGTARDWHAFVEWLEASDLHRAAYDSVAVDDALLTPTLELSASPAPANDRWPARRLIRWSMAGGGAAIAALLVVAVMPQQTPVGFYTVETAPGARRTLQLGDGTHIEMNGATRLKLRREDGRYAALETGEATFHVRHDPSRPFRLETGPSVIDDLGTVFNVARDGRRLAVQVADGSVVYRAGHTSIKLTPGMGLNVDEARRRAVVETVPAESVGGWKSGLVSFRGAPASAVARAVERSMGARVRLDDALAEQEFTGTIHLTGTREQVIPRVAALMNADWRREADAWVLSAKGDDRK